jgi:predicted nucleotidyltransferase
VDDPHDGPYAREPQLDDLARLARALNAHSVRYVLIGGFAIIAHGGARTTKDIDLLIDPAPDNVARVRQALQILEGKAIDEVADDDLVRYAVMAFGGVAMPVASPSALVRTKNTVRPSDAADRQFLRVLIGEAAR